MKPKSFLAIALLYLFAFGTNDPRPATTASYSSDPLYRLVTEGRTGTAPEGHAYGYDLAGNPTSIDGATFSYDAGSKRGDLLSDGDGNVHQYAEAGGDDATLGWDDYGRLVSAGSDSFGYSGSRRVESVDADGNKTFYIYAAGELIGAVNASGSLSAAYSWGANGVVSERLPGPGASRWYYDGPQGETRLLADATGAVVDTYAYSAYGMPVGAAGPDPNPFRYGGSAGYYTDPATGLLLAGVRWYDPVSARWLTRDPIGYKGGLNLYAYADDNPVALIDPTGLDPNNDDSWLWQIPFMNSGLLGTIDMAHGIGSGNSQDTAQGILELDGFGLGFAAGGAFGEATGGVVNAGIGGDITSGIEPITNVVSGDDAGVGDDGQTWYHYTNGPLTNPEKGLRAPGDATDRCNYSSREASEGLGIPPPDRYYPIQFEPSDDYPANDMGDAPEGAYGNGGLPWTQFPNGTPPGSVGGWQPVWEPGEGY